MQIEQLSSREQEIAEAFSSGENYHQIADRLCIAKSTVRTHLSTIYRKLGVSSKLQLRQHFETIYRPSDGADSKPALPDKPSIAVLPFENMSSDPDQEYFAYGMSEDIITALSRSPWLFVIARNSTFTYKGQNTDVRQIAQELGVSSWGLAMHDESISALERAVELNPNCSLAYGSLGTALTLVGRVEEGITNQEIAIRSNPRDPSIFFRFTGISLAHFLAGRYDSAIEWTDKAIHRMPSWYLGHFLLAASHVQENRLEQAKTAVRRCLEILPEASVSQMDMFPLKDVAAMSNLRDCLRRAGLPD